MQKLFFILLISTLSTSVAYGQKTETFEKLIEETNRYLSIYDSMNHYPYHTETYYSFKKSGLTKKEIKEILSNDYYYDWLTNKKDSIETYGIVVFFQGKIIANIDKIIKHKDFNKLNDKDLSVLGIIQSKDNKLYNFKLDEKSGGSYQSYISIMFYRDNSTLINVEYSSNTEENPEPFFKRDGYSAIDTINTDDGIKYVLTGWLRGCTACFETSVELVQFKDGKWINDFSYAVMSRSWEGGVSYDPEIKIISVNYETDDLTTDCTCETPEPAYSGDFDWDNRKSCECIFVFNGKTFELAKQCWEIIINEDEE